MLLAVLEIVGMVLVAHWIGVAWTLLLLLAGTVLGSWLLKREGTRAWQRFVRAAQDGPPGVEATDGIVGLVGALLLAIPGFLTDIVGLLLLLPPVRAVSRSLVRRSAERRLSSSAASDLFGPRRVRVRTGPPPPPSSGSGPTTTGTGVIEGEIVD